MVSLIFYLYNFLFAVFYFLFQPLVLFNQKRNFVSVLLIFFDKLTHNTAVCYMVLVDADYHIIDLIFINVFPDLDLVSIVFLQLLNFLFDGFFQAEEFCFQL